MNIHTITMPDSRIVSVKVLGDTSKQPLIFFHGLGSSSAAISVNVNLLKEEGAFIIGIDRPGYGLSDLKGSYSLEQAISDTKFILDSFQIKKAALIGWSGGGVYAQAFAETYPDSTVSLNLIGSMIPLNGKSSKKSLTPGWKILYYLNNHTQFLSKLIFKLASQKLAKHPEQTVSMAVNVLARHDRLIAKKYLDVLTKGALEGFQHKGTAIYADSQVLTHPHKMPVKDRAFPVHIWQGDNDRLWPVKASVYLKKQYTHSQFHLVPGKGHTIYFEKWGEIIRTAVASFK
ncbi:alpha/beta fold hydrolase [Mesobacillus harenae]|uniref:alpha/beta fold hydrolase n=1 Tax=Mesobacillus harenae TaxID=2213203 RepID=UPI0015805197|nr:alpha/beta hydrolase [Mesobacillus harenae]